jgi:hypothetical protein
MPCPCFLPRERSPRAVGFRLPLGAFWLGECAAGGAPDEQMQLDECNFGNTLDCPHLPPDREADAVRFDAWRGETLFILEKDHAPVRWGSAETIAPGTALHRQYTAWTKSRS